MVIKNQLGYCLLICLMPFAIGTLGFSAPNILHLFDNQKAAFHPDWEARQAAAERFDTILRLTLGPIGFFFGLFGGIKIARELFTERSAEAPPEPIDPSAIEVRK
jgi:hypothetical protein